MEPQIVKKPAMTLVGLQLHGKLEGMDIKSLWNGFGPRMAEIKDGDPNVCYGAMDQLQRSDGRVRLPGRLRSQERGRGACRHGELEHPRADLRCLSLHAAGRSARHG